MSIKKLEDHPIGEPGFGDVVSCDAPNRRELMNKINEIIDYLNELDTVLRAKKSPPHLCPKCGGEMKNDNIVYTSYPPQYSRTCTKCGHREYYGGGEL